MVHLSTAYEAPAVAPWQGELPKGRVVRLESANVPRWLQVTCGRVWVTATRSAIGHHPDRWLVAGDWLALPAGSDWVAEGDPGASYLVLEAPVRRRDARGALVRALRAFSAAWIARRTQGCISAGDSIASAGALQ